MQSIVTLTDEEKLLLDKTLKVLTKNIDFFVVRFYYYLFNTDARLLFQNMHLDKQQNMFASSLNVIFNHVSQAYILTEFIEDLAFRHKNYGVLPEHVSYFIDSFMAAIREVLEGEVVSQEIFDLWFRIVSSVLGHFQDKLY